MTTLAHHLATNPDAERSRLIGLKVMTPDRRIGTVNYLEHDAAGRLSARLHDARRPDLVVHVMPVRPRRRRLQFGVFVEERFCWYELAANCIIID